jgi:hypothetical protein
LALTDNIVAYWKLDESSGNPTDSVGSRTLTNNSSTSFVAAKINNGASFDGATDYFSRTAETLGIANAWTVGGWLLFDDLGGNEVILRWRPSAGDANEIRLGKASTNKPFVTMMHSSGSGTGYKDYEGTTTLSTATWYHVMATWDGTTLKLYLNGSENTPYTKNTDNSVTMTDTSRILGFGGWNGVTFHNGDIDEIGYWSRALSSTEISQLYNGGSGLQYPFTTGYSHKVLGVTPVKINGVTLIKIIGI